MVSPVIRSRDLQWHHQPHKYYFITLCGNCDPPKCRRSLRFPVRLPLQARLRRYTNGRRITASAGTVLLEARVIWFSSMVLLHPPTNQRFAPLSRSPLLKHLYHIVTGQGAPESGLMASTTVTFFPCLCKVFSHLNSDKATADNHCVLPLLRPPVHPFK